MAANRPPASAARGEGAPLRGEGAPLRGEGAPLRGEGAPLRGEGAPLRGAGGPLRGEAGPRRAPRASASLGASASAASGGSASTGGARPRRVLCLGDALLDLICERQLADPLDADVFVPHPGGAVANVAALAARAGAEVALAGGAGEDDWGRWLRERLEAAAVDTSLFALAPGVQTPLALVTVDVAGEATWRIYGAGAEPAVEALQRRLPDAVRDSGALFISSNTLVGERERELTMRARELALS